MNYKDLKPEEILLLDRICVILSHPAINKSLFLKMCGVQRMTYVHYASKKRCGFTSTNIESMRLEILRLRAEINNAFMSENQIKVSYVLKNKEILYSNIVEARIRNKLSPIRTGKRLIKSDEILWIKEPYLRLALQMSL